MIFDLHCTGAGIPGGTLSPGKICDELLEFIENQSVPV